MSSLFSFSRREEPMFYLGGIPVDGTAALIGTHVASMLVCSLLAAMGLSGWLVHLFYTPQSILTGQVWDLFVYPFYHDIGSEHIWFAVEMLMLFWFGRGVEGMLGRRNFFILYALLTFLPAVTMFLTMPLTGPFMLRGSTTLHFSIFLAFVMLFPRTPFFFSFSAKWLGIIFLGIYTLVYLSRQYWPGLVHLWSSAGTVWLGVKFLGANEEESGENWLRNWLERQERKQMEQRRKKRVKKQEQFHESVDHILEKISREGIHSLTQEEQEQLKRARAQLLKKDRH